MEELAASVKSGVPTESDFAAKKVMHAGYALAEKKDFATARIAFEQVAKNYRGTGEVHPDFGSIPEQAVYQSIVCLAAEGKTDEARAQYRQFIKDRPNSPLAVLAFRRLVRLNGGVEDPADVELIESALKIQTETTRKAIAACGPKVIHRYLSEHLKREASEAEIRQISRQDEDGTSMLNMVKALTQHGVRSEGYELNATDFIAAKPPFVWLRGSHYVLVEANDGKSVKIFDPLLQRQQDTPLPKLDDASFRAVVLTLSPM